MNDHDDFQERIIRELAFKASDPDESFVRDVTVRIAAGEKIRKGMLMLSTGAVACLAILSCAGLSMAWSAWRATAQSSVALSTGLWLPSIILLALTALLVLPFVFTEE
jgi:hypothetical protein